MFYTENFFPFSLEWGEGKKLDKKLQKICRFIPKFGLKCSPKKNEVAAHVQKATRYVLQ